jgi:hypothetical protein
MKVAILNPLIGKIFHTVYVTEDKREMVLKNDDITFTFLHHQDCCESVYLDDINGELTDLVGAPILQAEERTERPERPLNEYGSMEDSCTWTFYTFATIKGYVTVRWIGTSNGYYSESVDLIDDKHDRWGDPIEEDEL